MPTTSSLLNAARSSSLRERLLTEQLDRADVALKHLSFVLQDPSAIGLYPGEADSFRQQYVNLSRQRAAVANEMQVIRQQNAAIRNARPLAPTKERQGFYRSEKERNAAILGILERERRRNASLSRGDYARAKATAARSSKADLARAMQGDINAETSRSLKRMFFRLKGVDVFSESLDPCVEYLRKQKNRREVMFARGHIHGYRGRRGSSRSPC